MTDYELIRRVHWAMQDAPHDGKDFRQARAAIAAVRASFTAVTPSPICDCGCSDATGDGRCPFCLRPIELDLRP